VQRVVVVMEHEAKGASKVLKECTLPLTGKRVTDLLITDLGVFTVARRGEPQLVLIELATGVSIEEIQAKTKASFTLAFQ